MDSRVHSLLGPLYQSRADQAEKDLIPILGAEVPKFGNRGLGPQLAWRSILSSSGHPRYPEHRAISGWRLSGVLLCSRVGLAIAAFRCSWPA